MLTVAEVQASQGVYDKLRRKGWGHSQAMHLVARGVARRRRVGWQRKFVHESGMGQGQDYYNLVTEAQNKAVAVQSEMSAIGKEAWDAALQNNPTEVTEAGWIPVDNYLYSPMMAWWAGLSKKVFVTAGFKPLEADLREVIRLSGGTDNLIKFVKTLPPVAGEIAVKADEDRTKTEAMLNRMGTLTSPDDVARETLIDELQKRTQGLLDIGKYALPVAAIVGGFIVLKMAKII